MGKQVLVLSLGSNMGNRLNYLNTALKSLENEFGKPIKVSEIYETKAWGNEEQADFLNMAALYETDIEPAKVLKLIKDIEIKTGRKPREHWHEREIDIDIIFYGSEIINESNLKIPHPRMQSRNFVLLPLNEICPEYIHPVLNQTVSELLQKCTDNLNVEKWKKM